MNQMPRYAAGFLGTSPGVAADLRSAQDEGEAGESVFWSLTEVLDGIKSSTAHRINKFRRATGPVWERESFDRVIRSQSDLEEKFLYITGNPWRSNVVTSNEDYPWLWTQEMSSARAPKTAREARALPKL